MSSPHDDVQSPRYRNPIIDGDFPDPDAIRVGDTYYLIASSFNRAPGLPVLASTDLVNWELVSHALPAGNVPHDWFVLPRHGSGVWAPSIRHHAGVFHIVYPDPDQGVFVVSATDARGPWSEPRLLLAGLGVIDPCPLWVDDASDDAGGATYLVHGWANSRAGRKNVLSVVPVDAGLTRVTGPSRDVIDGDELVDETFGRYVTLEGPKFHRRAGWYWIFAPAGGVATGWQSVFRSRDPFGPYESRIVLAQGDTPVNGPHQGAWIDGTDGSDWFVHFQDRGVFGRVAHLQPMSWGADGWPRLGTAAHDDTLTVGRPVLEHRSPHGAAQLTRTRTVSDDFAGGVPGSQWAWQANPDAGWLASGGAAGAGTEAGARTDAGAGATAEPGLVLVAGPDSGNLRTLPRVLGQPLPGMPSRASVTVSLGGATDEADATDAPTDAPTGTRAGLGVLGKDYLWAGLRQEADGPHVVVALRRAGDRVETVVHDAPLGGATGSLGRAPSIRVSLSSGATADIAVEIETGSGETGSATTVPVDFRATEGLWIGAEYVLFAAAEHTAPGGATATARFERFRVDVNDEES